MCVSYCKLPPLAVVPKKKKSEKIYLTYKRLAQTWSQPILKRMEREGDLFSMVIPLDKSVGLIQKIPPEKAWKPTCQPKRRRKGCYLFQPRPVKDTQPVCTCSVGSWNSSPHYGRTMLIPGLCVFRPALTKSWHT